MPLVAIVVTYVQCFTVSEAVQGGISTALTLYITSGLAIPTFVWSRELWLILCWGHFRCTLHVQ